MSDSGTTSRSSGSFGGEGEVSTILFIFIIVVRNTTIITIIFHKHMAWLVLMV